ncbi:MAG: YncE family protein [Thermoplasmata archaeon]
MPGKSAWIVAFILAILFASMSGTRLHSPNWQGSSAVAGTPEITIPVDGAPSGLTFDPINDYLYVNAANLFSTNISVINTTTNRIVTLVPLPTLSVGPLATDGSTGVVYVGDYSSTVYAITPTDNRIGWTVPLLSGCPNGCVPNVQVYDSENGDVYVTSSITNNVSVIHGKTFVTSIPVGQAPNGAAYDSTNGEVFVSNEGSTIPANLTVIDGTTNRVVGQVYPSGNGPGVAYDSSNGDVYTCTNGLGDFSNVVTVANGTTDAVVASIPVNGACGGAVYDTDNDYVYITNEALSQLAYLSNVTLIDPDTNRVVLTQPVELGPDPIVYDPANHNVYVGNSVSDSISILPQIYRLAVRETGLPRGTNWSVTVNGTTLSTATSMITFPETNGSFDYEVPIVTLPAATTGMTTNYTATVSRGTVSVVGGPQIFSITFSNKRGGGGSSPGLFGLSGMTGYYVLGGSVGLILVGTVFALARRRRRGGQHAGLPIEQDATRGTG